MQKDILQLDGTWEFKEFPESARRMRDLEHGKWIPAKVPSSIYTCLAQAGRIDPFQLDANPEDFTWISLKSWVFRKQFDVDPVLLESDRIELVFDGLDTVSQIWLNDKLIGKTENMFISHRFDVTDRLKPSNNVLYVKLLPALAHAERLMQRYGRLSEHHFGDLRRSYIRKAQYQFGSVLGPSLVGCGIFRSVSLKGIHTGRIENLHVRTVDCNQHFADIRVAMTLDRIKHIKTPLQCRLHITASGLNITQVLNFTADEKQQATLIHIDRPILWWPRGYGVQHQYHLKAELFHEDQHLDTVKTDFGIRTIRVNRSADKTGNRFQFEVNEVPIHIKGANWMPLSVLAGETTASDYDRILQQAAEAHCNMLRVWGGGIYEDPAFYQRCSQLGILIWQDFMFASAYYPDRQWFAKLVGREAWTIIRQLRNYPCLAIWCGNSRINSLHEDGRLGTGRKFYGKAIYHSLLPGLLRELDPDREYIPSTPFSDTPSASCHDPASGTTHSWNVWNHYGGFGDYQMPAKKVPRFVTEFGLQSLPATETISSFALKKNLSIGSFELEKHNYQPSGQQRMARYVTEEFAPSLNLTEAVWQSQVTQARAVRCYVEHLRSHHKINAGCLIWTLNDSAPVIGFSVIDVRSDLKALYYYARRFFAPTLVTLTRPDTGNAPYCITVINDSIKHIAATLDCRLLDFSGKLLDHTQIPIALSSATCSNPYSLPKSFCRPECQRNAFLHLCLSADDTVVTENVYFFAPDKYLQWPNNNIDLNVESDQTNRWQVTLTAQSVTRDLQLIPPGKARLSDNFLTLLPGQPKTICIDFKGNAPGIQTPLQLISANRNPGR